MPRNTKTVAQEGDAQEDTKTKDSRVEIIEPDLSGRDNAVRSLERATATLKTLASTESELLDEQGSDDPRIAAVAAAALQVVEERRGRQNRVLEIQKGIIHSYEGLNAGDLALPVAQALVRLVDSEVRIQATVGPVGKHGPKIDLDSDIPVLRVIAHGTGKTSKVSIVYVTDRRWADLDSDSVLQLLERNDITSRDAAVPTSQAQVSGDRKTQTLECDVQYRPGARKAELAERLSSGRVTDRDFYDPNMAALLNLEPRSIVG